MQRSDAKSACSKATETQLVHAELNIFVSQIQCLKQKDGGQGGRHSGIKPLIEL
jgi:hypothetical protein